MLALRDNCLHPTSQKPYIKTSSGGADNSPEGIQVGNIAYPCEAVEKTFILDKGLTDTKILYSQNGITHGFVVEFASAEDRDYYVHKDPVHQAFVRSLDGVIEKAQAVDYTPGVY